MFLRLLVLCVCVGGRIALEQETRTPDANEQGKLSPASSPIAGHNWKYPRDQHQQQQSRQPRLLQMQHHSLSSDESTFRRPFDSNYLHSAEFDEEEAAASSNDVRNHNNIEPGQLNVHEAQLARLHGLGPAEIAALYNWQQRMRIPPIFASRNPPVATKRKSDPALNNPANLANDTQTPTWPKRSALVEMKKPEKEAGKSRGQGYSRKAEQSGKAGKQGGKSARRQQSQESVPHFDGPATNKGKDASPYEQHANRAPPPDVSRINRNLATQFLLRSPRENRQYDVPIIGKFCHSLDMF